MEAYVAKSLWNKFKQIVTFNDDASGINKLVTDDFQKAEEYFMIDGKNVRTFKRGINIIKMSDGTTKKILK